MPRKAMDYSKCIIYKIVCNDESVLESYVGHTTSFKDRKHSHKNNCNYESQKEHNKKLYQMIRENGGWHNWTMIPLEEYPCENYIQARIKEEAYRVELQSQLNTYKCFGAETKQEYMKEYTYKYRQEYKELLKEKNKKYRQTNKEQIVEKNKKWRESNKEKSKEYCKLNREQINEKARLRYQQKLVQTEK